MKSKKLLSLMLCLTLMFCGLVIPTAAAAGKNLEIASTEDFLRFAENCIIDSYSAGLEVKLTGDISLEGVDFAPIPIFCGNFDGQGHSITGLHIEAQGSNMGLFRYLSAEAQVHDLRLTGSVVPGGSRSSSGGLAGSNAGLIRNCVLEMEVSGADNVGGIAGENQVTGTIVNCTFSGTVSGSHFVGGITGNNLGVIHNCKNMAGINTSARENIVSITEITLDSVIGTETVMAVTDVGGIAGASLGVIRASENHGEVGYRQMGHNIGGIAGTQMGYIEGCTNYASIDGRKEVGGIVGQMEPTAFVQFEKDALQILQQQVDGIAGSVSSMGANVAGAGGAVSGHVNQMMIQVGQTQQALMSLFQDGITQDSAIAAYNVIGGGVANLTQTMQSMAASTMSAVGALSNNIYAMQSQIEAMRSTIGNITEAVGGTMRDVSDKDTPNSFTGKVENCRNQGRVHGDMNVGGITGAIAFENDLDLSEDVELGEGNSLNFVSEIRAVILNCENSGQVEVVHSGAGGIAGYMQFGLVKNSGSSGAVRGNDADYIGGVAGHSDSFIRSASAKGEVIGKAYVGGIAGEGVTVSDCRSMVILSGKERTGAILGWGEQSYDDYGRPNITGNIYNFTDTDLGGIDGVSYAGVAQPLTGENFYTLGGLSDIFRHVKLSFVQEDGQVDVVSLEAGTVIAPEDIPQIKGKAGHLMHWEGFDASRQYQYDTSFHAEYTSLAATLESRQRDEKGLPILLAEGSFHPESSLDIRSLDYIPALADNQKLIETVGYESSDGGRAHTLRYRTEMDAEKLSVLVLREDGLWQRVEHELVGSYIVVNMPEGAEGFALVREYLPFWVYYAAIAGAAFVILFFMLIGALRRRSRARKQKKAAQISAAV